MQLPFVVEVELSGWRLVWAELVLQPSGQRELAETRDRIAAMVRQRHEGQSLAEYPPVAAMRRLFRMAGCDPTRYRPSSEALLRRLLKGDPLPAIHPLVDFSNCLSADLAVPCCVMAEGTFSAPFLFRAGRAGDTYDSLRGRFNAEKKPLLLDALGPCDAPITGSQRVKVTPTTERAWLVAYLPAEAVSFEEADGRLRGLLAHAPVARPLRVGGTP